jgi:hypothetical protein
MNRQEWEQDVINRQRNIVFPDTNLNEGRFYRNIASGKAIFTTGQRISLIAVVSYYFVISSVFLAGAIGVFLAKSKNNNIGLLIDNVWLFALSLWPLLFWIYLVAKGLLPPDPPAPKRRRGYRSSSRG